MANCKDEVLKAIKDGKLPEVDPARLDSLAQDIESLHKADPDNFRGNLQKYLKEQELFETQSRIDKMRTIQFGNQIKDFALSSNFKDPVEGVLAYMRRLTLPRESGSAGMESRMLAHHAEIQGEVANRLTQENLWDHFMNPQNQDSILREMIDGVRYNRSSTGNQEAFRIAQILSTAENMILKKKQEAGFTVKERKDRGLAMMWDSQRVWDIKTDKEKAFKDFVATIDPLLNKELTFESRATDAEWQNKYYKQLFDQLSSRQFKLAINDGSKSMDKIVSAERQLVWKDGESFSKVFSKYSTGSIADVLFDSYEHAAKQVTLRERMGTDPRGTLDAALKSIQNELIKKDPVKAQEFKGSLRKIENNFMALVGGLDRAVDDPVLSAIENLRAWQGFTLLGNASFASVGDTIATGARLATINGDSFWSKTFDGYRKTLTFLGDKKLQQEYASRMGVLLEMTMGAYQGRMLGGEKQGGSASKLSQWLLKTTGLHRLTQAQQTAAAYLFGRTFADHATDGWSQLKTTVRGELKKHGLSEAHWEVMRLAQQDVSDLEPGKKIISPEEIRNGLSDDQLSSIMKKYGVGGSVSEFRKDTALRVSGMYNSLTRQGVPTPGVATRATTTQGLARDTVGGQLLRTMTQFKSYPIEMTHVVGSLILSNPETQNVTWGQFMRKPWQRSNMSLLGQYMVATTAMGYAIDSLLEIGKGKEPKDPTSAEGFLAAFVRGGAGTIYFDMMLAGQNKFGGGILAAAAGPLGGDLYDITNILADVGSLPTEDDKKKKLGQIGKKMVKFAASNTIPNQVLFKTAVDYIFLNQIYEAMDPGYLQRLEKNLGKHKGISGSGRDYLLVRPSDVNYSMKQALGLQ